MKPKPTAAAIDFKDDEEVVIVNEDDEIALTEEEIGNPFQITPKEELGTE